MAGGQGQHGTMRMLLHRCPQQTADRAPTCGSMQSGHRRPCSMAMAFSVEKSSLGRPQAFHCRMVTGSPRAAGRLNLLLQGT